MVITLNELYELKNKYNKEIDMLEMKKDVVDDLILIAKAKEPSEVNEEEVEETETEATDY